MPVPKAEIMALISALALILSRDAFSTLSILPRRGRTAWFSRLLASLADPPAESPSTMNSSHSPGFLLEQSASLPGRDSPDSAVLRRAISLAVLAAVLAFLANMALSHMAFAAAGFCSRNSVRRVYTICSTTGRTWLLPSFCFVWPSNWASWRRTLKTAVRPSESSSRLREESVSFKSFAFRA